MNREFWKKIIKNKIWIILLVVIGVRMIVYNNYSIFSIYPDTSSYVNYEANILKGEVDVLRTPIYPYIIKLISIFTINDWVMYRSIVLLQEVLSIMSVVVLYMTLKKEFKNQLVNYLATILYGCLPSIFTYNRVILTESLSISLFVMYFCLIIKYIKKPTNTKTIWIGLFTILLVMLRPSFIYLIIVLAIMFGLIFINKKENRKQAILGIIVLLCVISVILGYCYLNKKQNDLFGISNVTQKNQLDTVIGMGIYDTGDAQDEGIIDIINQKLDGENKTWYGETTNKIMTEYTSEQIDAYLKRCVKNNFEAYASKTLEKVLTIASSYCDQIYLWPKTLDSIQLILYFIIIYIYILCEAIYILVKIIKNREIPLEQSVMFVIIFGQLATIILGAQAEYSRLFAPVFSIVIIAIAWHIEEIIESRKLTNSNRKRKGNER